jgi:hypothetical protein
LGDAVAVELLGEATEIGASLLAHPKNARLAIAATKPNLICNIIMLLKYLLFTSFNSQEVTFTNIIRV